MTPQELCDLIQMQAEFSGHSIEGLEHGVIPFATMPQVKFVNGLLRKCGCPEPWRLYVVGRLVGREIRSTKDLGMYEASAIIEALLVGPDGLGDSETEPCEAAKEAIGSLLVQTMAAGVAQMQKRENGGQRVEVYQQLGFC